MAKILIIDDVPAFCKFLQKQIQVMGHTAVAAYTLAEVYHKAACDEFDVIYLANRMPDGNGLAGAGCDALRARNHYRDRQGRRGRDINAMLRKASFRRDLLFCVMALEIKLPLDAQG